MKKEAMLRDLMEKRGIVEKEKEAKMLKLEHIARQEKILKEIQAKVKTMKEEEVKEYKKSFDTEVSIEKENVNKEIKSMINELDNQKKLTDPSECYNVALKGFSNKGYIENSCKNNYGEMGKSTCVKKNYFCNLCCNIHIGKMYADKRGDCKKKCEDMIKA